MIDEFCTALGHFVLTYSQAEKLIKDVLAVHSGVSREVGRALFSDMRLRTILSRLRRIQDAQGIKVTPKLQSAFDQFSSINDMRDKLLHQGFEHIAGDSFATSNELTAHYEKAIKTHIVSLHNLEQMTADLRGIQIHFIYWGLSVKRDPDSEDTWEAAMAALEKEPQSPWLYKSPSPTFPLSMSPKTRRKRESPPPTSQA